MMGEQMVKKDMMSMMNAEMMNQIMEDPQKREQMMSMMKEHVADMDELLSSNLSDQEFSEKMLQLMNQHALLTFLFLFQLVLNEALLQSEMEL